MADGAPGEAAQSIDPKAFARLIKRASKDQIEKAMSDPAVRGPVLDEIFGRMSDQFRPENAPRKDSAIHWRITNGPDADPDVYETWIAGGKCTTSAEPAHEPRVALTLSGEQFLVLVSGNSSPTMMFMTGKVKLEGDIGFAAALTKIFDIPKA
ncbi:MAG TPA: SCP2 sterol-binding domain-containing protein [Pseudonocardiaceae bacterium]